MILDCFHFVSLLRTLNKLIQEKIFLQQKVDVSPISRVSAVNSGCSPMTQEGKSNSAMLMGENKSQELVFQVQLKLWLKTHLFLLEI